MLQSTACADYRTNTAGQHTADNSACDWISALVRLMFADNLNILNLRKCESGRLGSTVFDNTDFLMCVIEVPVIELAS